MTIQTLFYIMACVIAFACLLPFITLILGDD